MRFASLFAGVGGFDLAFKRVGMTCVAQVEIDARCREVLATHWPDVPRFEDVHAVSEDDIGTADLLCGGFPCQDYSVAGKRGGLAGDRGALWWQFHRLIDECRPRWVVGENVPGLLSSNGGRDFGTIVGSLVELGYGVVWRVLDAQYFGVAQRRRRVFIVGHIGGQPRPEILAFAEGCSGDTPPVREAGTRPAPTLASRTRGGGGLGTDTELDGALVATLETRRPGERGRYEKNQLIAHTLTQGAPSAGRRNEDDYNLVPSLIAQTFDWQAGSSGDTSWRGKARSWIVDQPERTRSLTANRTLALASPSVRRLTPLECERLQGFPDNWTAGQSDTQRYRQMGNAVAVPVAEWLGRRLVAA